MTLFDNPVGVESFCDDLSRCQECSLRSGATQVVLGGGPPTARVAVFGAGPGPEEDAEGRPFTGRAGRELDVWLEVLGLSRPQVVVSHLLRCRGGEEAASQDQIEGCVERWWRREMALYPDVEVLLPLGRPAAEYLVGKEFVQKTLRMYWVHVGMAGDEARREFHILPLPHPVQIMKSEKQRAEVLSSTLPAVRRYLEEHVPQVYR